MARLAQAGTDAVHRRLAELDREWDIERTLEANASTLALTGVVLGFTVHRRFFYLSGAVATFLLQHALQGWCPPIPIFRRMGVRTTKEINEERYALKALLGHFDQTAPNQESPAEKAKQALGAVRR